jgi:hypothetical protein
MSSIGADSINEQVLNSLDGEVKTYQIFFMSSENEISH